MKNSKAIVACIGLGCTQTIPADLCQKDKGNFWAGPIACYADKEGLESARYGDWLIQANDLRVVLRAGSASLTHTKAAGGGIVDIKGEASTDLIFEMLPVTNHSTWRDTAFSTSGESVTISGNVNGASMTTELTIGDDTVFFSSAVDWHLTPISDSSFFIDTVIHADSALSLQAEEITDKGGQLWVSKLSELRTSPVEERYTGERISVTADGTWLVFGNAQEVIGRLPINNGRFQGNIPNNATTWRLEQPPCEPGEWHPITEPPILTGCTTLILKGVDENGNGLPFSIHDGESWLSIPIGGTQIAISTDTDRLIANAGPGYEQRTLTQESPMLPIEFQRATPERLLMSASGFAHPDIASRASAEAVAIRNAAMGAQISLLRSRGGGILDAPELGPKWGVNSEIWIGAQDHETGEWTAAWPWKGSATKNPLLDLDPLKSLLHAKGERRIAMVSSEWMSNAPPPHLLPTIPDLMWLNDNDAIDIFIEALDKDMPTGPLGPKNWLLNLTLTEPSNAEKMAALYDQHLCSGNGPYINLTINGIGPGGMIESNDSVFEAILDVAGPQSLGLRNVEIVGPGGEIIAQHEIQASPEVKSLELPRASWYFAKVTGSATPPDSTDKAWAITAPIWIIAED